MIRMTFAILAVLALTGAVRSGFHIFLLIGDSTATVHHELVEKTSFGFSVVALLLALGFFAALGSLERDANTKTDQLRALRTIAEAAAATRFAPEAPAGRAETHRAERYAAEKTARRTADPETFRGGGRMAVEAAMLANLQAERPASPDHQAADLAKASRDV